LITNDLCFNLLGKKNYLFFLRNKKHLEIGIPRCFSTRSEIFQIP
jgi:hypothetical protein